MLNYTPCFFKCIQLHDKYTPTIYKKSAVGRICLLGLPMGKIPLKSTSFMKNQYLLTTIFYENQNLFAGKKNSTSQVKSL